MSGCESAAHLAVDSSRRVGLTGSNKHERNENCSDKKRLLGKHFDCVRKQPRADGAMTAWPRALGMSTVRNTFGVDDDWWPAEGDPLDARSQLFLR